MTPEELEVRLARAIRRHRELLKFSQEGFSDAIGMNRTYYGKIERHQQNPAIKNLQKIANGLGVPLSQLLSEAEVMDEQGVREPPMPPRRGRPPGRRSY